VTIFHPAQRDSSGKTSKKDSFTDLKKLPFSFCILALKRLMVLARLSLNCYIFNTGGLRMVALLETLQRTLLARMITMMRIMQKCVIQVGGLC
jgi:hypothetical protein